MAKEKGRPAMRGSRFLVLMIGCLLAAISGCVQDFGRLRDSDMPRIAAYASSFETGQATIKIERFNARALWEEFGGNISQADLDYKGKLVQVTGIIRTASSDDKNRPYLGFQVFEPVTVPDSRIQAMKGKEKSWYQEGFPPLVLCYFDSEEKDRLASVLKGQTCQLAGRCLGRVKDPSGFKDYVVVLDSCRIIEK
jgi:hypothetical protein